MKSARPLVTAGHLRFLLLALPLLLLVGAAGPRACPAIDVQCGDVLDIDYAQYRLNGDLVCNEASSSALAAITITGEGVHFNLAGFTITPGEDLGGQLLRWGINVKGSKAHINGGSIVDFNCPALGFQACAAILLNEDAHSARINGMSLHNNTQGIRVVDQASGARIHGNDITGNLLAGIVIEDGADSAEVTGNDLSDTGGFTFPDGTPAGGWGYIGSADDVDLIGNVANNCERQGIQLFGNEGNPPAQRNTIRGNTTLENGRTGILLFGRTEADRPRDNLIQSNTSFSSLSDRDLVEACCGTGPTADCLNTWKDNDFDVAAPDCIE